MDQPKKCGPVKYNKISYNEDALKKQTVLFSKVYNARKTFTWPVKQKNTEMFI